MIIIYEILKKPKDFTLLCKDHNVKYLYAFGSSVTDAFDFNKNDIDLLVEIDSKDPIDRGEKLLEPWDLFEFIQFCKTLFRQHSMGKWC
jgi:predicted nucleotidyltransferase